MRSLANGTDDFLVVVMCKPHPFYFGIKWIGKKKKNGSKNESMNVGIEHALLSTSLQKWNHESCVNQKFAYPTMQKQATYTKTRL